jgi:hypothetical protein
MNRGQHKTLVTVVLLIASLITAILIELIDGSAGSASTSLGSGGTGGSTSSGRSGGTGGSGGSSSSARVQQVAPGSRGVSTSGVYHTLGTNVRLRAAATTDSAIVAIMPNLGTHVTLTCYRVGQSVSGDPYWYQATYDGARGYVAGFWVATGPDPLFTRLRQCA